MWLLEQNALRRMKSLLASGIVLSAVDHDRIMAMADGEGGSRLLTIVGNVSEIKIDGILTDKPDILAMLFGGGNVTYSEIISAVSEAEQNPDVDEIVFRVGNSPGGAIAGLFAAIDVIQAVTKPTKAIVDNLAASATFALISPVDEILATNEASMFGSVGVGQDFEIDDNMVTVTSTASPKKAPDVTTDKGRADVREHLDEVHTLMARTIATGRKTTEKKVNDNFGQGGVMLAVAALKANMIDMISTRNKTTATGGSSEEAVPMNVEELRTKHPDAYAAAVREGVAQERDRVEAHLTFGKECGAMDVAVKAIQEGLGLTASLNAKYLTAGLNHKDLSARAEDNPPADVGDGDGGSTSASDKNLEAANVVAEIVVKGLGEKNG